MGGHPGNPPSQWAALHPRVVGAIAAAVDTLPRSGGSAPVLPGRDSCQKGWRLLYILAAYYKCSEVLRPFLLAFLQDASGHLELPFQGKGSARPRVLSAQWGRTPRGVTGLRRRGSIQPSSWFPSPPGIAKACEQNLRKTLQFGGRSLFPSSTELKAMVVRAGACWVQSRHLEIPPGCSRSSMGLRSLLWVRGPPQTLPWG